MVETKSRRRATQPENSASSTRREDWLDLVPPDDLPERDMKEDLGVAPAHEAFREAEKVFARIGISEPVEANDASPASVAIAKPARRVLPDLLAAAREQERANIQLPKTKPRLDAQTNDAASRENRLSTRQCCSGSRSGAGAIAGSASEWAR
jgi:hypothetical protein